MNIYDDYNIDYDNKENNLFIKVISEKEKFFAVIVEKNELVLEVHYQKNLEHFAILNGSLGTKLQSSNFDSSQKLERVLEVLHNKLWDYFHPQHKTITTP